MKILKRNYLKYKIQLLSKRQAEFVSFDLEMTGIETSSELTFTDLPFEKYSKWRSAAIQYKIIQVGLCLFIPLSNKSYEARPYNIYVFPRENFGFSPKLKLDVSAVEFNTKHGMDWNAWIKDGITYMTSTQAKKIWDERFDDDNISASYLNQKEITLSKDSDIKKGEEMKNRILEFLQSGEKELEIKGELSWFRRYIYEYLRKEHPTVLHITIDNPEDSQNKIIKLFNFKSESEKDAFKDQLRKEKERDFQEKLGFLKTWELLLKHKKKLIGHNMIFDLLFVYSHFIDNLPVKYKDFKKTLIEKFPEVYDTKFIINNTRFAEKIVTNSSLNSLVELIETSPKDFAEIEIILPEGFKDYDLKNKNSVRFHEAGYDAYATGHVFAKMYGALNEKERDFVKNSVNVMRGFYYMKNSHLTEEPFYKNLELFVISLPGDEKLSSSEIVKNFEKSSIKELVKCAIIYGDFNGAMLNIENPDEKQREEFKKFKYHFDEKGFQTFTYKEYVTFREGMSEEKKPHYKNNTNKK